MTNLTYFIIVGYWINNTLIEIPAWKMDVKQFEEARAHILARQKLMTPPTVVLEAPLSSLGSSTAVAVDQ